MRSSENKPGSDREQAWLATIEAVRFVMRLCRRTLAHFIMFTFMFVGSVAGSKQARNSICCATMAARSSSSCGLEGPPAKRLELLQSVQSVGKQTKASTMKMLSALQKRGALDSNVCERQLRSDIQAAVESVGKTMTPYGPIIQQVKLDAPRL